MQYLWWKMPKDSVSVLCIPSFYLKKIYFTYLAVSCLSLGTRDLVPWSGLEPRPPALGEPSLSHWTTRKWKKVKVAQSCPTLCNPVDLYNPWNSSGQNTGVGSFPFSRGSSQPRNRTQVSHVAGGFFTNWAIREAPGPPAKSPVFLLMVSPSSPSFHPIPTHPHGPCTPVCTHTHTHTNTRWYLIKSMPTMKAALLKILCYFLMFNWLMVLLRSTISFCFSIYSFY